MGSALRRTKPTVTVAYRKPRLADATSVRGLIKACPPLDLNSTYAYMLLCTHFAGTCVVAETDGEVVGFVSGYRQPSSPDTLFVWQVAVRESARGCGVAFGLLDELTSRPECAGVARIETTINPSNQASWSLFESFAAKRGAGCARKRFFRQEDFGAETHEEEQLLEIGPLA